MVNMNEAIILLLANLGIFFILVTLLTKLFHINVLLKSKSKSQVIYSVFFIALAIIVMQFPISTTLGNRIDLRSVAVFAAGIFGGPIPGLIVGSAAGLYRYFLSGAGAEIGLASCLLAGVITGIYSKIYIRDRLTQFNPIQTMIPVSIAVLLHIQVIRLFDGDPSLWNYRLWNFFFQFLGTLILTIILQNALKVAEKTITLERDLVTDKVTNIYNIKFLDTYLNRSLIEAEESRKKLSVAFLDLDHFKSINDNYGHQTGDEVLFKVAQKIKNSIRPTDIVGRYGGDEFLIILSDCDTAEAQSIGRRIMDNINMLQHCELHDLQLSVSMGIATYPVHGNNSELLLKRADNALYAAKNSGRNKLVIAS